VICDSAGIAMGLTPGFKRVMDPISAVLRPVSPLAWFPLSQVVFRVLGDGTTPTAIVATIGICCLWPTLMNTAFGVASLPEDFKTVSRVFQFLDHAFFIQGFAAVHLAAHFDRTSFEPGNRVAGDCRGGDAVRQFGHRLLGLRRL
jgi:ABC-type anion transport system duplicated permease subunit